MSGVIKIHALLACHNRRSMTLGILDQIGAQALSIGEIHAVLYDDGSVDGTSEAVQASHPAVDILTGDGGAFWATSMARAEQSVLSEATTMDSDYILWLNDDVSLLPDAIARAVDAAKTQPGAVIVGAMQDPVSGEVTYSGVRRSGVHPLRYAKVVPELTNEPVETFNGNFVLIPVGVARRLGGIDGEFSHSWADIDYGLRCGEIGVPVLLMPGYAGQCRRNPPEGLSGLHASWRRFTGKKGGGHPKSLCRILRRHGGLAWPAFFAATYVMWLARAVRRSLTASAAQRHFDPDQATHA